MANLNLKGRIFLYIPCRLYSTVFSLSKPPPPWGLILFRPFDGGLFERGGGG